MANFTININPIPQAWYTESFDLTQHDGCDELVSKRFSLGTWEDGERVADKWIFASCDPLYVNSNTTVKINNIYSTNPTTFYLEYNGVPLPNSSDEPDEYVLDIDITALAFGHPIPGLFIVFAGHDPDVGGNLSFQASMTSSNEGGLVGAWVYPRFVSQNLECEPEPVQEIFLVSSSSDGCITQASYEVRVPANSSRYVEIIPNDNFGTAAVAETITQDKIYNLAITGNSNGNYTTFSNVTLSTKLLSSSTLAIDSVQIARAHTGQTCV